MCGWESCEIVFASRSNRCRTSADAERCCGSTLIATVRSSRVSRGSIDLAHPPRADRRKDLVRTEAGAGGECHRFDGEIRESQLTVTVMASASGTGTVTTARKRSPSPVTS